MTKRCEWAGTTDPLMIRYHDAEWDVPCRHDRQLFERLMIESTCNGGASKW